MYLSHSSSDQSGVSESRSSITGRAGVATTWASSRKAMPRICRRSRRSMPSRDRLHQFDDDLLALAAHDVVDPWRFAQHLGVHERRMDTAQDGDRAGRRPPRDLQGLLRLVDHGRDGGGHDHVRCMRADDLLERGVADVVGHRIEEPEVGEAGALQRTADVGHPARRPVAGNLRAARVIIRLDHQNAHELPLELLLQPPPDETTPGAARCHTGIPQFAHGLYAAGLRKLAISRRWH